MKHLTLMKLMQLVQVTGPTNEASKDLLELPSYFN